MRPPFFGVFLLSVLGAGCYSYSLLQEPIPMAPGKVRGSAGIEGGGDGFTPLIAARVGVVPRVELRGKLALGGYEVGTNILALDTEAIDIMLMPSFVDYDLDSMFDEDRPVSLRAAALPIVVSIPIDVAGRYRVFVAPDARVGRRQHVDGAWSAFGVHIGGSLTGPRSYGSFLPECGFLIAATGDLPPAASGTRLLSRGEYASFSCSLGVSFGHRSTQQQ